MKSRDFASCIPCYDATSGNELCFLINRQHQEESDDKNKSSGSPPASHESDDSSAAAAASVTPPLLPNSSTTRQRWIGCNLLGSIFLSNQPGGWEIWRWIRHDDGTVTIASWTHTNCWLGSDADGNVSTTRAPPDLRSGRWTLEKVVPPPTKNGDGGGPQLLVRSVEHNRLLAIQNDKLVTVESPSSKQLDDSDTNGCIRYCYWSLEPAHRNQFFVTSLALQKRFSCAPSAVEQQLPLLGLSQDRKGTEEWTIEFVEPGLVTIQKKHCDKKNKSNPTSDDEWDYLACDETNGSLILAPKSEDKAFTWLVESVAGGGMCFSSGSLVLSVDESMGSVVLRNDTGTDVAAMSETWILEPLLPESLSRSKVLKWVGFGAIPVVAAVAAPFLVTGVVGAMGFGAGGITSGSMAAGMMAAEATALGGGVAAGGTVATLQSIGAAGLGLAGTAASVSGGAVVGGGIAAASSKVVLKDEGANGEISVETPSWKSLSFAGWRDW